MARRLQDLTPITTPNEEASVVVVNITETNLLTVSDLRTTMLTPATSSSLGAVKIGGNLSISEDGTLSVNSLTLPSQTGNSGKFLTTNGTAASWANIPTPASPFPSLAGNAGKYLTTNGQNVLWQPIPAYEALPVKTGNAGKYLTTNGTTLSWAAPNIFPSYSASQRDALTVVAGTVIWNTTATKLQVYTGSAWVDLH